MMDSDYSDKKGVSVLMDLFEMKGIRKLVMSPGSRNAPLLFSFSRNPAFEKYVIADERSAGFFALGLALASGEAVGLVCTSGTAMLNYAPAVAEAFYRGIPLVAVTADRPAEWIDQDEGQTIRQEGAMAGFVKSYCSLRAEFDTSASAWYANRRLNEVLNHALMPRRGPVHINMSFCEPLYGTSSGYSGKERAITFVRERQELPEEVWDMLVRRFLEAPRVMIVAGFYPPDEDVSAALRDICKFPHTVLFAESLSNIRTDTGICTADRVLAAAGEDESLYPELLISFGGSLVSRMLKTFLRRAKPAEHWGIDERFPAPDTFCALTHHICTGASGFWKEFAGRLKDKAPESLSPEGVSYAGSWQKIKRKADLLHRTFMADAGWSDLKAFEVILRHIPHDAALHAANSTPVRYLQLFEHAHYAGGEWSNRGTNGIEGATSTAMGFSEVYSGTTLLITGDLSFMYDSNALWMPYVNGRIRVIVMRNGGGGIFRFIPGPDSLKELETCFETPLEVPVREMAGAYGWRYMKAASAEELETVLPSFFASGDRAVLLEVETPRFENAPVLKSYFTYISGESYPVNR